MENTEYTRGRRDAIREHYNRNGRRTHYNAVSLAEADTMAMRIEQEEPDAVVNVVITRKGAVSPYQVEVIRYNTVDRAGFPVEA